MPGKHQLIWHVNSLCKSKTEYQACLIYAETQPIDTKRFFDTDRCNFLKKDHTASV